MLVTALNFAAALAAARTRKLFTSGSAMWAQSPDLLGRREETMVQRLIPSRVAAATACGVMAVALSCGSSFAFTLPTPSLAASVGKANVAEVYYYGHYYGHPYHHYAYHHPYHYNHYDNPNSVRHYVPKTNPYHTY
jgi:hypothetical protein